MLATSVYDKGEPSKKKHELIQIANLAEHQAIELYNSPLIQLKYILFNL